MRVRREEAWRHWRYEACFLPVFARDNFGVRVSSRTGAHVQVVAVAKNDGRIADERQRWLLERGPSLANGGRRSVTKIFKVPRTVCHCGGPAASVHHSHAANHLASLCILGIWVFTAAATEGRFGSAVVGHRTVLQPCAFRPRAHRGSGQ